MTLRIRQWIQSTLKSYQVASGKWIPCNRRFVVELQNVF